MSDDAALIPKVIHGDWKSVDYAIRQLAKKLGVGADPTFNSVTLASLTASRLVSADAARKIVSVATLSTWLTEGTGITITDSGNGKAGVAIDPSEINHDALLNFDANEHYLQTAITNVSTALSTGLLKVTTGTGALSSVTDNSANWNAAYTHITNNGSDHNYINQDVKSSASPTFVDTTLTGVLKLPTTSSAVGMIFQNAARWIHSFGTNNFFAGPSTGNFTLTGANNIGIGLGALESLSSGASNVCIGSRAGRYIDAGGSNFCLGSFAGDALTSGTQNLAIGVNSLTECVDKSGNVALGYYALGNVTGQTNIGIGTNAGRHQTTGEKNICIGYQAGDAASNRAITGCVLIGYQAGYGVTNDNMLYIANSATATPLVYGTFPNTLLRVNAPLEIRSTDNFCIGDATVDGSWQFIRSGNDLLVQRRESGSWVTKHTFSA